MPTRTAGGTKIDNSYNAHHRLVLVGLEAVRKRPGMYIGSTDSRGVNHLANEILDNATDEGVAGHASNVTVWLRADGSVESGGYSGSIHQVGAALMGAPSCNGWIFWHLDQAGKLEPIDALRQRHLSAS